MAARPRPPDRRRSNETNETPPPGAPLSPHWAFVVQLREGTPLTPARLSGLVEHLVSGRAALFASLAEMMAFMAQVLNRQKTGPTATASSTGEPASDPAPPAPRRPRRPSTGGGSPAP